MAAGPLLRPMASSVYDVVIIGSGPAGLTAAIYTCRANLKSLCIAGITPGGQLMITTDVENYPGFPQGVKGPELMDLMRKQAERFGTVFVDDDASAVDLTADPKKVWIGDDEYQGRALILATGAKAKYLGLPNETRLMNHGVSACATCDGFFFKNKPVVVVGGGDTAMEESSYLANLCSSVTLIHRRDAFRASRIMQDRVLQNPKITVLWDTEVIDVLGKDKVEGVRLKNVKTGQVTDYPAAGMFLAIGHKPSTEIIQGKLPLNETGYLLLEHREHGSFTSIPGVFAAGDVHDWTYRQAVTAAGWGCIAALDAERWLQGQGH